MSKPDLKSCSEYWSLSEQGSDSTVWDTVWHSVQRPCFLSPVSSHLVVRACIKGCISTGPTAVRQTHGTATLWMPVVRDRAKTDRPTDRLQAQTNDPSVTSQVLSLSSSSHGMRSDSMPRTVVFDKFFPPQALLSADGDVQHTSAETTAVIKIPAWSPQHFGYNTYRRRVTISGMELATVLHCSVT